jgi:structural maintenance of chromosome 4
VTEKLQNVNIDMAVLVEYRKRVEDYQKRSKDLEEAVQSRDSAKQRVDDLRERRLEEFMDGFSTISLRLKEMYQVSKIQSLPLSFQGR